MFIAIKLRAMLGTAERCQSKCWALPVSGSSSKLKREALEFRSVKSVASTTMFPFGNTHGRNWIPTPITQNQQDFWCLCGRLSVGSSTSKVVAGWITRPAFFWFLCHVEMSRGWRRSTRNGMSLAFQVWTSQFRLRSIGVNVNSQFWWWKNQWKGRFWEIRASCLVGLIRYIWGQEISSTIFNLTGLFCKIHQQDPWFHQWFHRKKSRICQFMAWAEGIRAFFNGDREEFLRKSGNLRKTDTPNLTIVLRIFAREVNRKHIWGKEQQYPHPENHSCTWYDKLFTIVLLIFYRW